MVIEGTGLPVSPLFFGVNLGHYDQALVEAGHPRPSVVARLRRAGVRLLKYPGGLAADRYRWNASTNDPADVDTAAFLALCRATGSEPVITVNSQAGQELAAAWVRYTNQGPGPPVRYWEFGDEAWGPWAPGHTDPATYVTRFRAAQAAMEGVDPAIRLAANVSLDPARAQAWNRPVLAGLADILEAVSFTFFPQDPGEEDHRTLQESTERFREQLAGLRAQVRELLGSRAQEVLFLLAGYNSVSWDPGPQTLGEGQLLWLAEMVGALIEAGVDLATYWTLLSEPSPRGGDYGLLQGPPAFRARPAYQVFAALRKLPGGRWWRLPTGLPDVGLQVLESAAGQVSVLLTNWSAAVRLVDLRLRYQGRVLHVGEAWQVTAGGTEELVLQGLGGPIRVPGRSVIFAHLVPESEAVTDYNQQSTPPFSFGSSKSLGQPISSPIQNVHPAQRLDIRDPP